MTMRWYERVIAAVLLGTPLWLFGVGPAVDRFRGARDGFADAQSDLAAGHLKLHIGGRWTPIKRAASKIADEDYGIEFVNSGCVPNVYNTGYCSAYDKEMQRELHRRSIKASVDTILQEAEKMVDANPQ